MDIADEVIARLSTRVYPIIFSNLRDQLRAMIIPQLQGLPPMTPLHRQKIVETMVRKYVEAMVKKNDPVGINAALTTGENLTQSSLQSHHHAGLRRGASGFERIEEITNMSNKSDIVKIITTPDHDVPRSKAEINELANTIVRVVMDDIIEDYDMIDVTIGVRGERVYPPWYSVFAGLRDIKMTGLDSKWLRLYFNKSLMYKYRIEMRNIEDVMNQYLTTVEKGRVVEGALKGYVLYPPIALIGATPGGRPYIDLHLMSAGGNEIAYYIEIASVKSLYVGGLESVLSAFPIPENLLTNLKLSQMGDKEYEVRSGAPSFVPPFAWEQMLKAMVPDISIIPGSGGRRFSSDVPFAQLEEMILRVPLIYADVVDGKPIQENGSYRVRFKQYLVNTYPYLEYADLEDRVFNTEAEMNEFLLEIMVDYHFFWYIEAVCSDIKQLYIIPEIDSTRTYTTSAIDSKNSLGYLAMRNMTYREFTENITINPIHIKVILNNMTLYKDPVSIRRQALKDDKTDWMTYATFEDVLKYMSGAAFAGESDTLQSVASNMLTGNMIPIGQGGDNMRRITKSNPTGNKFVQLLTQRSKTETTTKPKKKRRV